MRTLQVTKTNPRLPQCFHIVFIPILFTISCGYGGQEEDIEDIKDIMNGIHEAHLNNDANLWYENYSEQWTDVRNGQSRVLTKKNEIVATQEYLNNMDFTDLSIDEPEIIISPDGRMATYSNSGSLLGFWGNVPIYVVFSWMAVLQKDKDWKIVSTANTDLPESDLHYHVLKEARESLGKEALFSAIAEINSLADCKGPTGSFRTHVMSSFTKSRFEQVHDEGRIIVKLGEGGAWTSDGQGKVNSTNDSLHRQFISGHELHWLILNPESRFSNPTYKGITEYNDKSSFWIRFDSGLKDSIDFYYSFEEFKPLGFRTYPSGLGPQGVSVYYSDWKEVDGVMLPHGAIFDDGTFRFTYIFTSIELSTSATTNFEHQGPLINSHEK